MRLIVLSRASGHVCRGKSTKTDRHIQLIPHLHTYSLYHKLDTHVHTICTTAELLQQKWHYNNATLTSGVWYFSSTFSKSHHNMLPTPYSNALKMFMRSATIKSLSWQTLLKSGLRWVLTKCNVSDVVSDSGISILQFPWRFAMTEENLWCLLVLASSLFELLQQQCLSTEHITSTNDF